MRRYRSILLLLTVTLATTTGAIAQSYYDPPPAPPRVTPSTTPTALGGVQHLSPRPMGFGDNGESGTYSYDGSGNIIAIGSDAFLYDAEGRLVSALVRGVQGTYTYDAFGNRKTAAGETNCLGQSVCASPLTVSSGTNHLLTTTVNNSTTNVTYDAAGNITAASGGNYTYDGTGMMTQATVGTDDRQFVYTADDERIAVRQGQSWTWTVRGLDNKVLREFTSVEPNQSPGLPTPGGQWVKDYVWRDGLLLASTDISGTYHYHLDHLGTPRLITNMSHTKVAEHAYYPFGAEISLTPHESIEEAMKFTGHERDLVAGDGHTLDDMHARYYNASWGRFLSVDPIEGDLGNPQSWNRYAYDSNNPIGHVDSTGMADDDKTPKLDNIHLEEVDPYDPLTQVSSRCEYGCTPSGMLMRAAKQEAHEDVGAVAQAASGMGPSASLGENLAGTAVIGLVAAKYLLPLLLPAEGAVAAEAKATVQANKMAGDAFRDALAQGLRAEGRQVTTEVVKRTPFGPRRVDIEVADTNGRVLGGVETKLRTSRYLPHQRAKDTWLKLVDNYIVNLVRGW